MSADLYEIWQDLFLHGIHLLDQFHLDWCIGSSRPHVKDFLFIIPKMYHKTSYIYMYDGTTELRAVDGKLINVWVADSAVVKDSGSF